MSVKVTLKNGDYHLVRGPAPAIVAQINEARRADVAYLIELERNTYPTGQKVYIDPNEVRSVL